MTEIMSSYPNATVGEAVDEFTGRMMYVAYCDSDCAEEINFVPYVPGGEEGDLVIWFNSEWARRHIKDGRVEFDQAGYYWEQVPKAVFVEIIQDEYSIGAAANGEIIQLRYGDSTVIWRNWK